MEDNFITAVKERTENMKQIFGLIPKNAISCLDIGSGRDDTTAEIYKWLKVRFKTYTTLDIANADIMQDLNRNTKIKIKDNTYDVVIMSNILEHVLNPMEVVSEAKRISRKYILVGLPNEYKIDNRFRFLFSRNNDRIYLWGHKYWFSMKLIMQFINENFKEYGDVIEMQYLYGTWGRRMLHSSLKRFLTWLKPSFFAGEVFCIMEKRKCVK